MLVRSSKYLEALVRADEAETKTLHATAQTRQMKVEIERLRRELQEEKDDYMHRLLFKSVIVHLVTELSIEGLLIGVYRDSVVLRHARVPVNAAGDIEQLTGDQIIPRAQIGWATELMPKA